MPKIPFCRYADDGLLHCVTKRQAEFVMTQIVRRFQECGLEIHPSKSRIVYCRDTNRRGNHDHISFDFLGFTFRPRRCVSEKRGVHPNFLPAISRASKKEINRQIRSWHMQLKNEKSIRDLSNMFNPVLRGWRNYYGRFYPSELRRIWRNVNDYLVRWIRRKYKRLANHKRRARSYLKSIAQKNPWLFIHWELGCIP